MFRDVKKVGAQGSRPLRLLFVQTQAVAAGAQEISRILGEELSACRRNGEPEFEIHHLFFYRITDAFDGLENVHFCLQEAPRDPLTFLRFLAALTKTVRRIRPDVALTFQHYGNIFGAPAARLAGVSNIIANHVSAPATIGAAARTIDRALGVLGFYDTITVNSGQTLRDYEAYPSSYRKRLVMVPHGFAEKTTALAKEAARASFGLPAGTPLIGSVARLHPLKQLDVAIGVAADLPGVHLAFAGTGPDEERLRGLVSQAGLEGRVHFLGELPPQDVGRFLACLDVFVFPSAAETFGLAPVEAAQAGVPVVANDLPVLREVLEVGGEACALFADAGEAATFSDAVRRILEQPSLSARLSGLGRGLSGRHSLGAMVKAYHGLILGQPSAGANPSSNPRAGDVVTSGRVS